MDEIKKQYGFYAMIHRLRYIDRWNLMRSREKESVSEHSFETAILAHALALIGKNIFHKELDENKIAVTAMFHDAEEVITGDMPTPVKYRDPVLLERYRKQEAVSRKSILSMLPEALQGEYDRYFAEEDETVRRYVKAADKLSAYIKCMEEASEGNHEFNAALKTTLSALYEMNMDEVGYFLDHFTELYSNNLDELTKTIK